MSNSSPYKPTTTELKGGPEKFLYELRMFRGSVGALQNLQHPNPALQTTFRNATLESMLVHARNLLDFFCGAPSAKDDIRAGHFVSKGGSSWTSSKLGFLKEHKDDINKHLSHLTFARVGEKPQWEPSRIQTEIEAAYAEFLGLLPESERKAWQA